MVRSFLRAPVLPEVLDPILDAALSGPSAGNTRAIDLVVLEGSQQTERYWNRSLTPQRRASFPWPGLLDAPVLVLVVCDPTAYVRRYGEPDKVRTGLGTSADAWPVPYWFVDGGAATMALLYAAVDVGLGALLFGPFDHEGPLKAEFGVPDAHRLVATVAIGHPGADRPSASTRRPSRTRFDRIHRAEW